MSENSLTDAWRRPSDVLLRLGHAVRVRQVPLLMAGAIAFGAAVLIGRIESGWWHHDDGSLAHSAERVLNGELPHRDFAELYTGLLTFLNAGVFAVFGEDIFNLRIPLFVLFLAFVGCFFAIARRLVSPIWAFVATLAAVTWSVPVYPAPMPSWYLLFLTTFGMYSVIRYFETRRSRWLFVAGLAGGFGVAIKIVGIWFVIGATLALLVEPVIADPRRLVSRRHAGTVIAATTIALGLAMFVLSSQLTAGNVASLLVPIAALLGAVALIGYRAWQAPEAANGRTHLGGAMLFLCGAAIPLVLFAIPYVVTGSVGDLIQGVLIAPRSRFEFAAWSMPNPATLLWAVPLLALLVVRTRLSPGKAFVSSMSHRRHGARRSRTEPRADDE